MCMICLQENPFEAINRSIPKFISTKKVTEVQARASLLKIMIESIESADNLCHIGEGTLERLKEEQFKNSRQL